MEQTTRRFGYGFALASFAGAAGYSIAQLLQVAGVLPPPWDEIAIYGFSLLIAFPFMLALWALHRLTPEEKKLWSGAGLLFAALYAAYVSPLYVVQLATAIPLSLRGTPEALFAMHRYSALWTLDAMGYLTMGLATLFAAGALPRGSWVRRFFLANGLFTPVIALVYFLPDFSVGLLLVATPWIVTAPGSILLLARRFRQRA